MDTDSNKEYAVFTLLDYTLYTKDYTVFMLIDTAYTRHYVVFSGGGYYLYYALRSTFGGWIQFISCTTQYFRKLIQTGTGAY